MINGGSTSDINSAIDELVDFSAQNFYVKFITEENASFCKNILKEASYLMLNDLLPVIKDNKDEVQNFVNVAIQMITGSIDVDQADHAIDQLRSIVMSQENSAATKDTLVRLANILSSLNELNVFKDSSAIDSYIVLLRSTADGIDADKLMSEYNAVVIFDGLKIVTRIADGQNDINTLKPMIENWYTNGFFPVMGNSFLTAEQVTATDTIFKNIFTVLSKEDGKYLDETLQMVNEVINIIQNQEGYDKIISFVVNHKSFFSSNMAELVSVMKSTIVFVPSYKQQIESVILLIENLNKII